MKITLNSSPLACKMQSLVVREPFIGAAFLHNRRLTWIFMQAADAINLSMCKNQPRVKSTGLAGIPLCGTSQNLFGGLCSDRSISFPSISETGGQTPARKRRNGRIRPSADWSG